MLSGDDITYQFAKASVLFNADTVWSSEDETHFRKTNLEEWIRLNIIQSLLRSKLSDCFAVLRSKVNKTVRHVIPFSHVEELKYYKFDECTSCSKVTDSDCESEFKEALCKAEDACVEPWMLPEVEESFNLLCNGQSSRCNALGCKLEESGYGSHGSCGKFCPFFQIKDDNDDGSVDLELDVLTKENDLAGKEPVKCPCSAQEIPSEEILDHYRRLLSQAKYSEIVYNVCEQEKETNLGGNRLFPIGEEKQGFSRAFSRFLDHEEYALYQKISSENVKNIWKRAIPEVTCKNDESNVIHIDKSSQIPYRKVSQYTEAKNQKMGACHLILPPKVSCLPSKPPGLNVEVPEFYPRKDDISLSQEVAQLYFPSGSFADFSRSLFPYIATAWEDSKVTLNSSPPISVSAVNNVGHFPTQQKISLTQYGIQADFQGPMLQQYQPPPNFQNQLQHFIHQNQILQQQQQQQTNPHSNFLIPNQHALIFPGADHPPVTSCQNLISRTSLEQQAWMANAFRSHYQQQLNNQALPQADQSIYSSQHATGFQHRAPEIVSQFAYKNQYEQKPIRVNQPNSDTGACSSMVKVKVDKEEQCISPPKNIPVFLRPPESYNFSQNDNSGRRRNGGGGGGGGAVLANLIVLTKGGGRWKSTRHQGSDHGFKEKAQKEIRSGKGEEKLEITSSEQLDQAIENLDRELNLLDISEGTLLANSQLSTISESSQNQNLSEEISTIVFESSLTNSTINDTIPKTSSNVTPESTINLDEANDSRIEEGCSKESSGSIGKTSRDSGKGMFEKMTSTPIKKEMDKAEHTKPLKWLDAVSQGEELSMIEDRATQNKEIGEDIVRSTPVATCSKVVQASKSLENRFTQWNDVKGTLSDPSFPPIQSQKSRISRLKPSDSSWTPTLNISGHRRLYSDVLVPRGRISSSNCKDHQVSDASSSMDSLEKRFGELEMLAMEQYQSESSDESVARKYHELEMQAVEQYRSSCESDSRISQDRSSTSVKGDPTETAKGPKLPIYFSPSDLEQHPLSSMAHQNKGQPTKQPNLNTSNDPAVITLHEVRKNENFNQTISSTSLTSEKMRPETECGKACSANSSDSSIVYPKSSVKSETEIHTRKENTAVGISLQPSHPHIPSCRLKNQRSKSSVKSPSNINQRPVIFPDRRSSLDCEDEMSCSEVITLQANPSDPSLIYLPQISQLVDWEGSSKNSLSARHEAPNEQRTQASTTAGTKSEDKKEDPIQEKGIGVPEAWVLNRVHAETSVQCREPADDVPIACMAGQIHSKGDTHFDQEKRERAEKRNELDQGSGAPEAALAPPAKSKENIASEVAMSGPVEKDDFVVDENKRESYKKRRRGNRRKTKKGVPLEVVQAVPAANLDKEEDASLNKVSSNCVNKDVCASPMVESKATSVDCTKIKGVNPCNSDHRPVSRELPMPCVARIILNTPCEENRNAEKTNEDAEGGHNEHSKESGGARGRKKGGAGRNRKRNRKTHMDKGLVDALSEKGNRPLSREENSAPPSSNVNTCNKVVSLDHVSLIQENSQTFPENDCVEPGNELQKILKPELFENEYHPNVLLAGPNQSTNFHFSVSPPEILDELNTVSDGASVCESVHFNTSCSSDVEEVAGSVSSRKENRINSEFYEERAVQQIVRRDRFKETKPLDNRKTTKSESEKLYNLCLQRDLGCTAARIGREVDLAGQLMIPSICEEANLEENLGYDVDDCDIDGNAICSMNLPVDKGSISTRFVYKQNREVANDVATHPISSSIPMATHFGFSDATYDVNASPMASDQSLHYQISAQSLSRISIESTPRTPRSSTSTKSTSSSPSVLCKLMRNGKKTRKPKGGSCSSSSGRSTPSCTLQ